MGALCSAHTDGKREAFISFKINKSRGEICMVMNSILSLSLRTNKSYIVTCNTSTDTVLGDGGWWVLNLCVCLCLMLPFGMSV